MREPPALPLETLLGSLERTDPVKASGSVRAVVGLSIRARMPDVRVGDSVRILRRRLSPLAASVVGFDHPDVLLMPLGDAVGVGPEDVVESDVGGAEVLAGDGLLGRIVDGLGAPMDGAGALAGERVPILRAPPPALERPRIRQTLPTGVRAIDGLLTLGQGQRIGLFAGSGVGKSTLLGQIARGASADVVVVCLIGERGREVVEFLEDSLGPEGRARSVVVCATSDAPAMVRLRAAYVATAIAERFRDDGRHVLLLMDSLTRFARAGREVALAAGEPPARRGYPPSVFAALAPLLERAGTDARGSITGIYTVLVEGGDMEEPVADEVRGILDGHVVLDRALAARGRYPAIDVVGSLSRLMPSVARREHVEAAARLREAVALYESKRDLVLLGAYQAGTDPRLDAVLAGAPAIEAFLRQAPTETGAFEETVERLRGLA
jgi:ATP synthase in type III secretion protein N